MGREGEFVADCWYVPLTDSGAYRSLCTAGHQAVIILQQMRFEVLAETALQAILDGYYRDAVSSFAASLERFHEYYCQAVLLTRKVDGAQIVESWKLVRSQSERQLGMFVALHLLEENQPPPVLPQQSRDAGSVAFRNRVIHQGYLPTEEEAITFGQTVIGLVETVLGKMRARYGDAMDGILQEHYANALATLEAADQQSVSFMYEPMVYRMIAGDGAPMELTAEIAARRSRASISLAPSRPTSHG